MGNGNWELFLATFSVIFVAELPDKTALAILLMATRQHPLAIFLGVAAAFAIQSLVAVTFGHFFALLPEAAVHLAAGLLFIGFALHSWRSNPQDPRSEADSEQNAKTSFLTATVRSFLMIFMLEWGDLTQLATASLAAHSPEFISTIFVASTLALWTVSALVIFIGQRVGRFIEARLLHKIGAVAFAGIGLFFIFDWWRSL